MLGLHAGVEGGRGWGCRLSIIHHQVGECGGEDREIKDESTDESPIPTLPGRVYVCMCAGIK